MITEIGGSWKCISPCIGDVLTKSNGTGTDPDKPRLVARVHAAIRMKHYSERTEKAYLSWIKRYIRFHDLKHPAIMGKREITEFLSYLAVEAKVSASTQNQALAGIIFLYRDVLNIDIPWLDTVVRAKARENVPVVLSRQEVRLLLSYMDGVTWLMATLLYGGGLRLLECCCLRLKDLDFSRNQITIRRGKGGKDRVTLFPAGIKTKLGHQVQVVKNQHRRDLANGAGWVLLEGAMRRKFPAAGKSLGW